VQVYVSQLLALHTDIEYRLQSINQGFILPRNSTQLNSINLYYSNC